MNICYKISKTKEAEQILFRGETKSMSKESRGASSIIYDEQGTSQVSEQIMDAYNSGVIDQSDGQFIMPKGISNLDTGVE
jgi:hypothetical protein